MDWITDEPDRHLVLRYGRYLNLYTFLAVYSYDELPSFSPSLTHGFSGSLHSKVFASISLSRLYRCSGASNGAEDVDSEDQGDGDEDGDGTGYKHRVSAAGMIRSHGGSIFVASNSPLRHVSFYYIRSEKLVRPMHSVPGSPASSRWSGHKRPKREGPAKNLRVDFLPYWSIQS